MQSPAVSLSISQDGMKRNDVIMAFHMLSTSLEFVTRSALHNVWIAYPAYCSLMA
jgi:hypothetical protein